MRFHIFPGHPPDMSEWKNPKEGRSLGDKPDGPALPEYPFNYPQGAGDAVDRSIRGDTENQKTFHQGTELDEKQRKSKEEK